MLFLGASPVLELKGSLDPTKECLRLEIKLTKNVKNFECYLNFEKMQVSSQREDLSIDKSIVDFGFGSSIS